MSAQPTVTELVAWLRDEAQRSDQMCKFHSSPTAIDDCLKRAAVLRAAANAAAEADKDRERLDWCADNEVQFGVERGAENYPDQWIVYQKQRWDLPLGVGATARHAIDAARAQPNRKERT